MLAEEAKACFSPWSTCWLHSSLEFEKSLDFYNDHLPGHGIHPVQFDGYPELQIVRSAKHGRSQG